MHNIMAQWCCLFYRGVHFTTSISLRNGTQLDPFEMHQYGAMTMILQKWFFVHPPLKKVIKFIPHCEKSKRKENMKSHQSLLLLPTLQHRRMKHGRTCKNIFLGQMNKLRLHSILFNSFNIGIGFACKA